MCCYRSLVCIHIDEPAYQLAAAATPVAVVLASQFVPVCHSTVLAGAEIFWSCWPRVVTKTWIMKMLPGTLSWPAGVKQWYLASIRLLLITPSNRYLLRHTYHIIVLTSDGVLSLTTQGAVGTLPPLGPTQLVIL